MYYKATLIYMKKQIFKGKVIEGQKLGSKIGIPTANLDPKIFNSKWEKGVYSAEVTIGGNSNKKYLAVLFYGPKTIANEIKNSLELHVLDFNDDIYGKIIEVKLLKFIRGAMVFSDLDSLVTQIKKDIDVAKQSI